MKLPSIIAAIVTLTGCASAPPRPASVARDDYASTKLYVTKLIQYEMKKNKVAGLSIALVDDQRVIWADGFGYADQEQQMPATAETLYRVGSISKLFTDTAAMQLVEQGKLNIDQPLRNYLPGFSIKTRYPNAPEITPRQLMTHHAGLPRDRLQGFMTPDPAPFTEVVNELHEDYAAYPPNQIFSYSNLGITLLGSAIQNLSGIAFADYMQQAVLTPLGMSNSSFDVGLAKSALMAKGYRGREVAIDPPLRDVPAGGLNSSVTDMSRFMSMIFADGASSDHRILKPETLAEMLRPQNADVPLDFNFRVGLGWMLSTVGSSTIENAGTVAHHSGGTILFHSQMYVLPDHKLGVVVLSNSSTSGQVVDHIATETLTLALEAKTGIRQPQHAKTPPDNTPLAAETLRDYVGDYTTLAGFARIQNCGKRLCAEVADQRFNLVRGNDGLFRLDYSLLGIFHIDLGSLGEIGFLRRTVDGRDLLVARAGTQEILAGQRITLPAHLDAWKSRLGDYEIMNLDADQQFANRIRATGKQGYIFVEMTESAGNIMRIPLQPVSDTEALLLGPLNDGGETIRVVMMEGNERLLFSGYQLRKIER